ncbi:MAG: glutamine synthetase, partial [Bryobacteraceae bacterium]
MTDAGALRAKFEQHKIRRVKLGVFDIDCTLRGKYVSLEKFWSALETGLGFCDVLFGWDIGDVLYDNAKVTGWHTGYPDAQCQIDAATFRTIPWEPETAFFLLDFVGRMDLAPRQVLAHVIEKAQRMKYAPMFAAEYEFFIFKETPESLRAKNYRGLTPLSPGMFGYSVLRASENRDLVLDLFDHLAAFSAPLEGLHTETGPGVYEAAIAVEEAMVAADRAALFKTAAKEIGARHGVMATFMAKWNAELPGSSGHLHQSLWDAEKKKNLFADPGAGGMSELMKQY